MSNAEEKFCALDSNYFNLCAVVVYQNFGKLCCLIRHIFSIEVNYRMSLHGIRHIGVRGWPIYCDRDTGSSSWRNHMSDRRFELSHNWRFNCGRPLLTVDKNGGFRLAFFRFFIPRFFWICVASRLEKKTGTVFKKLRRDDDDNNNNNENYYV